MTIRRINIFGSPGVGKSVTAAWLFANLKIANYNIQFVEEHAKRWACQKKPIISFDQMFLTAMQINAEDEYLRSGIQYVITDAPVIISYFYATKNNLDYCDTLLKMGGDFEKIYPSINIYLTRNVPYQKHDRYETEEESKLMDAPQLAFLSNHYPDLIVASPFDKEELFRKLDNSLGGSAGNQFK